MRAKRPARVACRYCEWSRPAWWTSGGGRVRSGWDALKRHMIDDHGAEWDALQKRLGDEDGAT